MPDPFQYQARSLSAPAERHFPITPSDSVDLTQRPRVLYCSLAGTVVLRDQSGVDLSYVLEAGQILLFSPQRVLATGTSATVIGWL